MAAGKILIVDDDQNICELLRLYIEKEGFDVRIANDGRKALEIFEEYNPDLILLDIMLPNSTGGRFAARCEKNPSAPSSCSPPRARCLIRCSASSSRR